MISLQPGLSRYAKKRADPGCIMELNITVNNLTMCKEDWERISSEKLAVGKYLKHLRDINEHNMGRGRKQSSRTIENIDRIRVTLGNLQPGQAVETRKSQK